MMKNFTLSLTALALSSLSAYAVDGIILTTPQDVLDHSIETIAGSKQELQSTIESDATDADKTAAMQKYMQSADPKPGYVFDMSFLLHYNSLTEANKGTYTRANLAKYWHCDIDGVSFGNDDTFILNSTEKAGYYMRIASTALKEEKSHDKFAIYQNVNLSKGSYELEAGAFCAGVAGAATLSAGDIASSSAIAGGGILNPCAIKFNLATTTDIKLGLKRNNKAGNLTQIAFNNMYLYKVSDVIVMSEDATEGLAAAENATVQFARDFNADEYVPICVPFIIENWRDIFEDVIFENACTDGMPKFKTLDGANTQARKPYLVKVKEDIDINNYLTFSGVKIETNNPGTWTSPTNPFPVFMQGNWAKGTVPENCYYFDGDKWRLSDGTVELPAFSAYLDATALEDHPASFDLYVNNVNTGIDEVIAGEINGIVNVYNIQGMIVRQNIAKEDALDGLPAGIYIMNGKKIVKR